jgi:hypothetical protein
MTIYGRYIRFLSYLCTYVDNDFLQSKKAAFSLLSSSSGEVVLSQCGLSMKNVNLRLSIRHTARFHTLNAITKWLVRAISYFCHIQLFFS